MIFITDELGKFEKNIIELAENMGFKECKTIEAIDLFCGISEKNDVLKEKDRYYAFIDIPQYWSVRADGLNGAIYDNKTKKANIYFKNPIEKRMVSRVEWIDRNNTVYRIDYYNKSDICFVDHAVTRCFHFAGNYNRFPFLAEYHGKTPIYQYDANKPDRENDDSFCWRGYFEQEKLMHELSKGGFGLVWSDDEYFDRYYSMNQPYKLGTNLAAGIPVIVKRGCVHDKFVERNGLGYAVDTLDEADKLVQSITDAEYIKLYHNVKNIQKLILDGAYTRKTLQDAIIEVLENACTPVENRYQDHI